MVKRGKKERIYILTGGESRRMGQDKAWVEVAGQPMIRRVLAVAEEVAPVGGLVVSLDQADSPAYQELARERTIRLLPDRIAGLGPLGGLATALHDAGPEATVLLLAVDLPLLTEALLHRLLSIHWRVDPDLTVPLDREGHPQPLTACYQGTLIRLVTQLLDRRERRLTALCAPNGSYSAPKCLQIPFSNLSDLPGADQFFLNCNRWVDLPPPSLSDSDSIG
ncbi:MAG: molybdenum cofactor guanylyltransferase [Blastocatellia bacterium]